MDFVRHDGGCSSGTAPQTTGPGTSVPGPGLSRDSAPIRGGSNNSFSHNIFGASEGVHFRPGLNGLGGPFLSLLEEKKSFKLVRSYGTTYTVRYFEDIMEYFEFNLFLVNPGNWGENLKYRGIGCVIGLAKQYAVSGNWCVPRSPGGS